MEHTQSKDFTESCKEYHRASYFFHTFQFIVGEHQERNIKLKYAENTLLMAENIQDLQKKNNIRR